MRVTSGAWALLPGLAMVLGLAACGTTGEETSPSVTASAPAAAATEEYRANLTGAQENPPTSSGGTGNAAISFAPATHELSWTINYSGLTGPVTAAHFHGPAAAGQNAGVLVPITVGPSPLVGSATLTQQQADVLHSGQMYVNLHTAAHPDGEIRGQVAPGPAS